MSPRSSKQITELREEKKKLIMETALELFAENGVHATSISQIAKKAKISKGLTYNYFESKSQILEEIIDQGFYEIHSKFDPNRDGVLTSEEFELFINQTFEMVKNNHRHWKLYFSLMLQPAVSENFAEKYQHVVGPMLQMIQDYIISRGSSDPEGDLIIISALFEGAILYAIVAPEIFPIDLMKQKIISGISRLLNYKQ